MKRIDQSTTLKKSPRKKAVSEKKKTGSTAVKSVGLDHALMSFMKTYDNKYDSYLRRTLGKVLPGLMMTVSEIQPSDGINFIAQALHRAAQDQLYLHARLAYTTQLLHPPPPASNCYVDSTFDNARNEYTRSLRQELHALTWLHEHIEELPEDVVIVESHLLPKVKSSKSSTDLARATERRLSQWREGHAIRFQDEESRDQEASFIAKRSIQIGQIRLRLEEVNRLMKIDAEERKQRKFEKFLLSKREIDPMTIEDMKMRMNAQHLKYQKENAIKSSNKQKAVSLIRSRSVGPASKKAETEEEVWKEMSTEAKRSLEQEPEEQIEINIRKREFREARSRAKRGLEQALLRGDYKLTRAGVVVYCSADWTSIGLKPPRRARQAPEVMKVDSPLVWGEAGFRCQVYVDHETYFPCDDPAVTLFPKIEGPKTRRKSSKSTFQKLNRKSDRSNATGSTATSVKTHESYYVTPRPGQSPKPTSSKNTSKPPSRNTSNPPTPKNLSKPPSNSTSAYLL